MEIPLVILGVPASQHNLTAQQMGIPTGEIRTSWRHITSKTQGPQQQGKLGMGAGPGRGRRADGRAGTPPHEACRTYGFSTFLTPPPAHPKVSLR